MTATRRAWHEVHHLPGTDDWTAQAGVRVYGPAPIKLNVEYQCRDCGEPFNQRDHGGAYFALRSVWCCLGCWKKRNKERNG